MALSEISDLTPRGAGYWMPAEWSARESTWISWPHNEETWPSELERVEAIMARAVAVLSRSERVRINVDTDDREQRARQALEAAGAGSNVSFHRIATNDAWVRDYGPLFVVSRERGLAATCWGFNSWGGKYPPYGLDDAAARKMAEAVGVDWFDAGMILEGGSIDVNGSGLLITTESCLLHPSRNPDMDRGDIQRRLGDYLGVEEIIWLPGGIAGDDTDGHIDDLARFVGTTRVVAAVSRDFSSRDYDVLQTNLDVLRSAETDSGPLEVIELPMPEPVVVRGEQMPATYANFYIGKGAVLVPVYGDTKDQTALDTLQSCFPDRDVVGIDCRDLIWGLGAFHCLTQQVPLAP